MGTGWAIIAYENTMKKYHREFMTCEEMESCWIDQSKWRFENVDLPYTLLLSKRDGNYLLSRPCDNRKADVGLPGLSVAKWCALEGIDQFIEMNMGSSLKLYGLREADVPIRTIPGCFTQPFLIEMKDHWIYLPRVSRGTMVNLSIGKNAIKRWFPLPNFSSDLNPGSQRQGHADYAYKKYVDLHAEIDMLRSC